jgi:hypothetical protein
VAELGDRVDEGFEGVELWAANRKGRQPLTDSDIDIAEAEATEEIVLDVLGRSLCDLEGDSVE